jgi:hypothetical protein
MFNSIEHKSPSLELISNNEEKDIVPSLEFNPLRRGGLQGGDAVPSLPKDLISLIMSFFGDASDLRSALLVCKSWHKASRSILAFSNIKYRMNETDTKQATEFISDVLIYRQSRSGLIPTNIRNIHKLCCSGEIDLERYVNLIKIDEDGCETYRTLSLKNLRQFSYSQDIGGVDNDCPPALLTKMPNLEHFEFTGLASTINKLLPCLSVNLKYLKFAVLYLEHLVINLDNLPKMENLTDLSLSGGNFQCSDWSVLLQNITSLRLKIKITNASSLKLENLIKFTGNYELFPGPISSFAPRLRCLTTNKCFDDLRNLPDLNELHIQSFEHEFTNQDCKILGSLTNLRYLELPKGYNRMTNLGMRRLKKLVNLVEFDSGGAELGDAAFLYIKNWTKLKRLSIQKPKISMRGVDLLLENLPASVQTLNIGISQQDDRIKKIRQFAKTRGNLKVSTMIW